MRKAEGHFDRTLQVNGSVSLDVSTGSGDIIGEDWQLEPGGDSRNSSQQQLDLWRRQRRAEGRVQSSHQQSGNSIRIGENLPDDVKRHVAINYEITVPAGHYACRRIAAREISGSMEFARPYEAETGSGDIRTHDIGSKAACANGQRQSFAPESSAAPFGATDRQRRHRG